MKKILIVEDDQIVANIYRNKFSVDGFRTRERAEIFAVEAAEAWVDARVMAALGLTIPLK